MKIIKSLCTLATFALFIGLIPQSASAQWSLGASYEIRNEEPENGFGVRVERDLLGPAPVLNLSLRAHFSYFNEDNAFTTSGATISPDITSYDYGLAAVGGVSIGLLSPYIGLGLGSTTIELSGDDASLPDDPESNLYWNGFIGAKISPIPVIKPFVEYRIQSTQEFENLNENVDASNGRLIFGVSLSF